MYSLKGSTSLHPVQIVFGRFCKENWWDIQKWNMNIMINFDEFSGENIQERNP